MDPSSTSQSDGTSHGLQYPDLTQDITTIANWTGSKEEFTNSLRITGTENMKTWKHWSVN